MESPNTSSSQRPKLHPLVATAAGAVILLSVVGIGALVMNHSNATPSPYEAPVAAQTQRIQPQQAAAPKVAQPVQHVAATTPNYHRPAMPSYGTSGAPAYDNPAPLARADVCHNCGVVDSIHDIKIKGEGTGVGGVGGAVVGGLLGNQIGAGRGKALATVAGAVGGAFAGNAIEKNVRSEVEHQMVVRLENGTTRTFTQVSPFPFGVGERVRIVDGHVERG